MPIIKQSEFLKLSYYGDTTNYKLMICCPHAYEGGAFLEKFPQIRKQIKLSDANFSRYLAIEQDFATEELGELVASICAEKFKLPTLVIQPLFPRSIIDAGRFYPHNLRNILEYESLPELKQTLLDIHSDYIATLKSLVRTLNDHNGIALDLHTMSPYSPLSSPETVYSEALEETPDSLSEYIAAYKTSHINGYRREVELFTGEPSRQIYAYQPFIDAVYKNFTELGIKVDFDTPYVVAPHLVGCYFLQNAKTVCVDIPKDLISTKTTIDKDYSLANLTIDTQKLDMVAHVLASAAAVAIEGELQ